MLASTVDSVKFEPPTLMVPVPFCRSPSLMFSPTQPWATSGALFRSTSTAALSETSSSVVSAAETAFRSASRASSAAAALTAGMTLSAFCRSLSSSRTTSLSPATGAQSALPLVDPPLLLLAAASPPVPEEPDSPQAARPSRRTDAATGVRILVRVRMLRPPSVSRAAGPAATRVWREVSRASHATPHGRGTARWGDIRCAPVTSQRDGGGLRTALPAPRPRQGEPLRAGGERRRDDHEQRLGQQREDRDQQCAGDDLPVVLLAEAEVDDPAEPAAADQGGKRRRRHDLDRRRPDAGHDQRHGERELDPRDHLTARHAHRARRLPDVTIDLPEADERVGQHRRHGEQGQGHDGRRLAEAQRGDGEDGE